MGKTVADLDAKIQLLLNKLQQEIPLAVRPYRLLGEKVGLTEEAVLEAMRALKAQRILRQCSAIFDTRSIGYRSSLVAVKAPPARLEEVANVLNEHPGISHNYARNHTFNIWFTIAAPEASALEAHIEVLKKKCNVDSMRLLPTLKLFKIGMKIDTTGGKAAPEQGPVYNEDSRRLDLPPMTELDKACVRALQIDMDVCAEPYASAARNAGLSMDALFEWCARFQQQGRLRRVAGVMNHRIAGFQANGMGVWEVPVERIPDAVSHFTSVSAVTHCYLRPTYPDWPYNVFTMVHEQTVERCDALVKEMSRVTGVEKYDVLYSSKQFKKIRLQYFTGQIRAWEKANGLGA